MSSYNPFDAAAQREHQDTQSGQPHITFIKERSRHYDETVEPEKVRGITVLRTHPPKTDRPERKVRDDATEYERNE